MAINFEPINPVLGAEVAGVNLAGKLGNAEIGKILGAFTRHHVLLFRNQDFDADAHEAFAKYFGPLEEVRTAPEDGARTKHVMYVANRPVDGKDGILPDGEMHFHTDQCYYQIPAKITSLYAMEVPSTGGNTLFLNACAAYEALSTEMKERLRGLSAEHVYDYGGNPTLRPDDPAPDAPRYQHPVVIAPPMSGEPSLYVNRLMTSRIVGMPSAESDALLEELFRHMEQPRFIHEHIWQSGDLLMWDNLCTMHARTDFDPAERRVLRRVTVRGTQPEAAVV
jgi:taurine dioxygenase